MTAIILEQLQIRRGDRIVIRGIDLTIEAGRWFGLIGANGSGKTSLLRAMAGRLPIEDGRCTIGGDDLAADRHRRAQLFGFAPPPERLPGALRGGELLELVCGSSDEVQRRLGPVGEALGIDRLADRWIGNCSAGMKQRIALASAFVGGHDMVILDEPLNWLDPVAAFDFAQALRHKVDEGLTLITALHDLGTLVKSCGAGAMLSDGAVSLRLDPASLQHAAEDFGAFERRTIDLLRSRNEAES